MIFNGSGVALITPFNEDKTINYKKLEELIEFHITNFTDAIIICGTTGESSTLDINEKKELIKFSVEKANGRIPIIAGTGSNNINIAIKLSKYAEYVGVDGLLIVTPYYNKCSQEGLYLSYKQIANNVTIPILLYNVPSRTGVNIELDTVIKLSKISNIVGIKEASGNISQIAKIISKVSPDFYVYSGNDDQVLPILSLGGKGVISVAANIIPFQIHTICDSFFKKDFYTSKDLFYKYLNLMNKLFIDINPIPIKEAMNILDYNVGKFRLPLCSISSENYKILKKSLDII
ncbi:MAG: 4-hydroxy-tetrahydrodipicolinate synthase [Clostridia bacterium]